MTEPATPPATPAAGEPTMPPETTPDMTAPTAPEAPTTAEAAATATSTATTTDATATTADAAAATTDATAATTDAAATTADLTPAAPPAPVVVERTPRRRLALLAGLARLVRIAVMAAIFVGGVALGYARFQSVQPVSPTAASPVTTGESTPTAVHALILALSQNDLDAARSSVSPVRDEQGAVVADPYRLLAGELQAMRLQQVSKVQLVGTFVDGQRTATAIVISGRSTQGADVSRQLIVQTVNGNIVSFK